MDVKLLIVTLFLLVFLTVSPVMAVTTNAQLKSENYQGYWYKNQSQVLSSGQTIVSTWNPSLTAYNTNSSTGGITGLGRWKGVGYPNDTWTGVQWTSGTRPFSPPTGTAYYGSNTGYTASISTSDIATYNGYWVVEVGYVVSTNDYYTGRWWILKNTDAPPQFTEFPTADFECNNDWRGDPSPFSLTCINNGENVQTGNTTWRVISPNSSSYVEISSHDLEDQILNTVGRWSVELTNCNPLGCDTELKTDYVLVLGSLPQPNVTPTVYPNVTPVQLIATLQPTLIEIVNRSAYRSTIEETLIGNITAPYLDFIDDWADTWIDWVDALSANLNWPLVSITDLINDVLDRFKDAFDAQYENANIFLYWIGVFFAMIPASVMGLITYKLLIEIIKAVLET